MKRYLLALLVLMSPACSSQSTSTTATSASGLTTPTNPSAPGPAASVNVSGKWVFALNNLTVTWDLTQTGDLVLGMATVADTNNPYYGSGVVGAIAGTVSNAGFTYTQTHTTLLVAGCTETDTGVMTMTASNTMTGTHTEVNTCKRAPAVNVVTFVKQ